jgi:hypothetical protein
MPIYRTKYRKNTVDFIVPMWTAEYNNIYYNRIFIDYFELLWIAKDNMVKDLKSSLAIVFP